MLFKRHLLAAAVGTAAAIISASAPLIVAIDAATGPTAFTCPSVKKGLNDQGCFLTIIGRNLGNPSGMGTTTKVFIGGFEVAAYMVMDNARTSFKNGLQRIIVQVGALGNTAAGTVLPVKVRVSNTDSNANWSFTPCVGKIWFVSLAGVDNTVVAGDPNHPARHLQTVDGSGQINGGLSLLHNPGDHTYVRGGNWADVTGGDGSWYQFRYSNNTGIATRHIHFSAYPGEDVHYSTPSGKKGGFQGAHFNDFDVAGDYVSISNMRFDVDANATSDACPLNMQAGHYTWRLVNNEVGPWHSAIEALAAGISGHAQDSIFYANYLHDIDSITGNENHGFYADSGATGWDVGYNVVVNMLGGNLLQTFDNAGLRGLHYSNYPPNWLGFENFQIHHNWFENSSKHGLNLADGICSAKIWNNVIIGAGIWPIRLELAYPAKVWDVDIQFNVFYDGNRTSGGSFNSQVVSDDWNVPIGGQITIQNNIFVAGPNTRTGSNILEVENTATYNYLLLLQNVYFPFPGRQTAWASFTRDAAAIHTDPKLQSDMTLGAGSSAINAATASPLFAVLDDYLNVARPQGVRSDIGAFEAVT